MVLTENQRQKILETKAAGGSVSAAAKAADCAWDSAKKIYDEDDAMKSKENKLSNAGADLEVDKDVLALKKQLKLSMLKRQMQEIDSPAEFEERLDELQDRIDDVDEEITGIHEQLKHSLLVPKNWECARCSVKGKVAVKTECTSCHDESTWGWH